MPGEVSFKTKGREEFLALCTEAAQAPELVGDSPSDWRSRKNRYDYVVVAPEQLLGGAQALADYRAGTGYNSAVFDLQDLYDECNGGIVDAKAIKDCFAYAFNRWKVSPLYFVVVGEGEYRRPAEENGLPPVRSCATPYGLYPCDNWFVDFDGDGLPEVPGGRILVSDDTEMRDYVAKVEVYESGLPVGSEKLLWVADNPDSEDQNNFHADSDTTAALIGGLYDVQKLYFSEGDDVTVTRNSLVAALNAGPEVFHWTGHGGPGQLADEQLFLLENAAALTNSRTPIFVALTCTVAYGAYPGTESLVETLLGKAGAGIAGAFAPTGQSWNYLAHQIDLAFTDALYGGGGVETAGEAAAIAVGAVGDTPQERFMRDIYWWWGDPALKVWR